MCCSRCRLQTFIIIPTFYVGLVFLHLQRDPTNAMIISNEILVIGQPLSTGAVSPDPSSATNIINQTDANSSSLITFPVTPGPNSATNIINQTDANNPPLFTFPIIPGPNSATNITNKTNVVWTIPPILDSNSSVINGINGSVLQGIIATTNMKNFVPGSATCRCRRKTIVNVNALLNYLKSRLKINIKDTSKYKRKFISVDDNRNSCKVIGTLGVIIISSLFAVIAAHDFCLLTCGNRIQKEQLKMKQKQRKELEKEKRKQRKGRVL